MIYIECPHCQCQTYIESINCAIFRHGVFKDTLEPIPPHSPKEVCDALVKEGRVYGCCKPFRMVMNSEGEYEASKCDYI